MFFHKNGFIARMMCFLLAGTLVVSQAMAQDVEPLQPKDDLSPGMKILHGAGRRAVRAIPWRCINGMTTRDVVGVGGNVAGTLICERMTNGAGSYLCEFVGYGTQITALVVYDNYGYVSSCMRRSAGKNRSYLSRQMWTFVLHQEQRDACVERYSACLHKKKLGWVQRTMDFISPLHDTEGNKSVGIAEVFGTDRCVGTLNRCVAQVDSSETEIQLAKFLAGASQALAPATVVAVTNLITMRDMAYMVDYGSNLPSCVGPAAMKAIEKGPPKDICTK